MSTLDNLFAAIDADSVDVLLQPFNFDTARQNQMLFFVKPEVFLLEREASKKVCALMWDRLAAFGVEVAGAYLMSAETLEANQIMDRHYGYINQVSRTASSSLSEEDRAELRKLCNAAESVPIRGGHEVLAENPSLKAKALDELWASKKSQKLRSGLYVESFDLGGTETVIVNGFHPYQLEHFTGSGRKICLILLNSDLPWKMLRSKMLGDTFPERAGPGSIRGDLNRNAGAFGFDEVTIANNCAHMSAGAFEAVFELSNFLSGVPSAGFSMQKTRQFAHFARLGLDPSALEMAISNPAAPLGSGSSTSLFDATEEGDALSAAALYQAFFAAA